MPNDKSVMDFEILEQATEEQKNIANWFFLKCSELMVTTAKKEREKYREEFEELKKAIMPDFDGKERELDIVKRWWSEEMKWYCDHEESFPKVELRKSLLYRIQRVFFKNHGLAPLKKEARKKKVVDEIFYQINQNLFQDFLKFSIEVISKENDFQEIESIVNHLEILKSVNIAESVKSSTHKLYGKDWRIFKGLAVGGAIGGVTSIFLGPVIGTFIGELAGFSGAAATSYGLALLGGGSIASGGFGMAGGSLILGLGFGISNGVRGMDNASQDELNQAQARVILPLLVAIGKIQLKEIKDRQIPKLIHSTISERLWELRQRLEQLEMSEKEEDKKKVNGVQETVELYQNAVGMSENYKWSSIRDLWQGVKKWAS